jgi:soluble lytic murein transglycosylase
VTPRRSKSGGKSFQTAVLFILAAAAVAAVFIFFAPRPSEDACIPFAVKYAAEFRLEPELVLAVIKKESSFDPGARGAAGEYGLMQVMPATGEQIASELGLYNFTPDNLLDAGLNVRFGAYWLSRMRAYEGVDEPWAFRIAEYNAGAARVDEWLSSAKDRSKAESFLDAVAIPSVKRYVRDVLEFRADYKNRRVIGKFLEKEKSKSANKN